MSKIILVVLNLFAFFIYNLFFGGDLTIVQNFPDTIKAGESFTIEIEIEKGDREGFAKWQQSLPEGFIATAKNTAGATFSFKNQDVKIIWMSLPEDESFTISYDVKTDTEMQGDFALIGQFSFIEQNQRKDISSAAKSISITNDLPALAANPDPIDPEVITKDEETQNEDSSLFVENESTNNEELNALNTEEEIENDIKDENSEIELPEGTVASREGIIITRNVKSTGEAKYNVTLTIKRSDLNSFGKIEDYLPPNYIATADKSMEGIFSFKKNVMKILWMTMPEKDVITVSYLMESTSDELDSAVIHGAFSYLDGAESKQLKLNPTKFENTFIPLLVEEAEEEEEKIEEIVEEVVEAIEEEITASADKIVEPIESQEIETAPINALATKEELTKEITNIPAPESSVRYKVQIAAAKREVNQQYFIDRHSITQTVSIEFHETWYKYTIGGYDVYKQARDKRNEVWATENKINDAFVTAYNSGERISVQEALMITQQKWFK